MTATVTTTVRTLLTAPTSPLSLQSQISHHPAFPPAAGTLIAQTASASVEAFLRAHFDDLRGPSEQKEALFVAAFRQAHEK